MVLMQDLPTLGPQSTREADDWIGQTESHRRKEFRRGNKGVVVVVVGGKSSYPVCYPLSLSFLYTATIYETRLFTANSPPRNFLCTH